MKIFLSLLATFFIWNATFGQASPTLQCVFLNGNQTELNWTFEATGDCATGFENFQVFRSAVLNNNFQPIETTANGDDSISSFIDNTAGGNNFFYYIAAVCGTTVLRSDTINNGEPISPGLDIINVIDVDGTIELSWDDPDANSKTFAYVIYNATSGVNPLDTVEVSTLVSNAGGYYSYTDPTANPINNPETYTIAVMDGCGNVGEFSDIFHSTVYLEIEATACDSTVTLSWTDYRGWDIDEIDNYAIYNNNSLIKRITRNDPSANLATTYEYTLPVGQTDICLEVEATKKDGTSKSRSNEACASLSLSESPEYLYLTNISINPAGEVELKWIVDAESDIFNIRINRGASMSTNPFQTLTDAFQPEMSLTDSEARADEFSYFYDLSSIDACNLTLTSQEGNTILLEGETKLNLSNSLEWTPFELEYSTLQGYNIYRLDENGFPNLLTSVDPDVTIFEDQDAGDPTSPTANDFCYYVEAIYDLNLPTGLSESFTSNSNQVCIGQNSRIFTPNAFQPNGVNNIFKPLILFPNYEDYQITVLNRWGTVVFQSSNPDDGWDGYYKGELAPQGVYLFHIRMTSSANINIQRQGSVLLIR